MNILPKKRTISTLSQWLVEEPEMRTTDEQRRGVEQWPSMNPKYKTTPSG